jgi:hypothetical protein
VQEGYQGSGAESILYLDFSYRSELASTRLRPLPRR